MEWTGEQLYYVQLKQNAPVHVIRLPYAGTRTLCGRYIPIGSTITGRPADFDTIGCLHCHRRLRNG